jgi:hypothetical protein
VERFKDKLIFATIAKLFPHFGNGKRPTVENKFQCLKPKTIIFPSVLKQNSNLLFCFCCNLQSSHKQVIDS